MNKKERIIMSALEVFREHGIEKAKVSDIVKGAGVAQGTFYLYFSSKLSVMPSIAEVVVQKMLDEIQNATKQETDFRKQLKIVIDVVFDLVEKERDIFALMYAGLAATEYLKEWEAIYSPYYNWMNEELTIAKETGLIQSEMDIEEAAILLIGLIESAAEQVHLFCPKGEADVERKKCELYRFSSFALGLKEI